MAKSLMSHPTLLDQREIGELSNRRLYVYYSIDASSGAA